MRLAGIIPARCVGLRIVCVFARHTPVIRVCCLRIVRILNNSALLSRLSQRIPFTLRNSELNSQKHALVII